MTIMYEDKQKTENYGTFLKDKKVLIIEDDTFLGDILTTYLHKNNAIVTLVTSGENAMEYLKSNVPDILVLDIFLPGINGLDFLENFRKNTLTKKIPVLVLSNSDQTADKDRAKSLGADFFTKAVVTPNEIINHLYQMLSGVK